MCKKCANTVEDAIKTYIFAVKPIRKMYRIWRCKIGPYNYNFVVQRAATEMLFPAPRRLSPQAEGAPLFALFHAPTWGVPPAERVTVSAQAQALDVPQFHLAAHYQQDPVRHNSDCGRASHSDGDRKWRGMCDTQNGYSHHRH
jgi:hypothetical protein